MKLQWLLIAGLLLATIPAYVSRQPRPVRATIATPDARCIDCKRIIEAVAPKYADGLVTINVIYQRGTTQVSFYKERTNIEVIKAAIATAGFKADNVMPRDEEVAKLPACCKPKPQPADSTQN